jgi:hypothetical protein
MRIHHITLLSCWILIILLFLSCSKENPDNNRIQENNVMETSPNPLNHTVNSNGSSQESEDGIWPTNTLGDNMYEFLSTLPETLVGFAINMYSDLTEGDIPTSYQDCLDKKLITIICNNRYTGNPIISTEEYSAGDFYYNYDFQSGVCTFKRYQGPNDINYDPDISDGNFMPWGGDPDHISTDGKTFREVNQGFRREEMVDNFSKWREYFGFPSNDEARVRIFIVYDTVNYLMYQLSQFTDQPPSSLDQYIQMAGAKNPDAWINPYNGQPMREVGWFDVPLYYDWQPVSDPISDLDKGQPANSSEIAGNYAFNLSPSPAVDGADRAYVKFYFRLPDGSIAAYLAIGVSKAEFVRGSLNLG